MENQNSYTIVWQPEGIEHLKGKNPSYLFLESVKVDPNFLEIMISDLSGHTVRIVYDQACAADYAVWYFEYDTHDGRMDLRYDLDVQFPTDYDNTKPYFMKTYNAPKLEVYKRSLTLADAIPKAEIHTYSTINEFFRVISEYDPVITIYEG
ncbi:hypothetical protein JMA_10160 [Jeotgalibacillus malaysiensis]|uniref:Uncharacterized protein n=1 Tax=Jeotgalibacillus malaysiensis TaxID=1508404 RepID=A0A0B5APB5_9BACL|nr:hypothetical protein [Jeotgalibacillus malaysiensis]AJD90333.1 hypothetical protein JMA_10160 [Jeotgalibacillus malaysiensis]